MATSSTGNWPPHNSTGESTSASGRSVISTANMSIDTLLWVLHQAGNGFLQLFAIVVLFRLFMLLEPQQAADGENSD